MPRPTPITAAAVLLIALGGQFIVAFAGYALLAVYGRTTGLLNRLILPECCWCIGTPILAILGIDFLRIGIGILCGYQINLLQASFRIATFGALAIFLWSLATVFAVITLYSAEMKELIILHYLPVIVPIVFDSFAMLVAGVLLKRNSEKYQDWQKSYTSPTKASGYEDEE